MTDQIEMGVFSKNRANDIRVSLIIEHGKIYIDIRQWKVIRGTTFPTGKGVRFDTTYFIGLRRAVDAINMYLITNHLPETT